MNEAIKRLKTGVRARDRKLIREALAALSALTDRQCYRIALAADPSLSMDEWADLRS